MRYIDLSIIDAKDPDVVGWIEDAKIHSEELKKKKTHSEREEYMKKHGIWSKFKPILTKYFGEKCWYSECALEGSFIDVDHFRPKNRSKDEQGNIILDDGYWWLAYDYLNYRLSCEKSNRNFGGGGKNDMFPLKSGTVPSSQGYSNDVHLLLDPCVKSDVMLIDCDENGEIIAMSDDPYEISRVDISRRAYNWDCFNNGRKKIRLACQNALEIFEIMYTEYPEKMEHSLIQICNLVDSQTPYSSFARRYIERKIKDKPYKDVLLKILNK